MQSKIAPNLNRNTIDHEGVRPMWAYLDFFVSEVWADMKKESGLDVGLITVSENKLSRFYLFFKNKLVFENFVNKILKEKDFLNKLKKRILLSKNKIVNEIDKTDYADLSLKELMKATNRYLELTKNIYKMAVYLRCIDRGLRMVLDKNPNRENIEDSIPALMKPSYFLKEKKELEKLANKIKAKSLSLNSEFVKKELRKIKDRFCWISYGNYKEEAKSIEDYKKELKEAFNSSKNLSKDPQKINISKSETSIAKLASESAYLKDEFKFFLNEVIFKSEKLFKEISNRSGKTIEFIKNSKPEDIILTLEGKSTKSVDKKYVLIGYDNKIEYLKKPDSFIKEYIKTEERKVNQLKGRIASKGKGKGVVKIVLGQESFGKFKKGNVLVVNNTTPNYVSIMKKATGIVAEEGGLTAHVSVVSREFKIPCIVGIKNITNILKDGDLVEVDANKGIVKILKRK